jgi:hypothetical protein
MNTLRETLQTLIAALQDNMERTVSNSRTDINVCRLQCGFAGSTDDHFSQSKKILATARSIHQLASPNMYFMIPQTVSPTFTGRKTALDDLKTAFATPGMANATKRFVIYGLGGSGKSQFCCKFAQENRQE